MNDVSFEDPVHTRHLDGESRFVALPNDNCESQVRTALEVLAHHVLPPHLRSLLDNVQQTMECDERPAVCLALLNTALTHLEVEDLIAVNFGDGAPDFLVFRRSFAETYYDQLGLGAVLRAWLNDPHRKRVHCLASIRENVWGHVLLGDGWIELSPDATR